MRSAAVIFWISVIFPAAVSRTRCVREMVSEMICESFAASAFGLGRSVARLIVGNSVM